jgi:hypothetical protein
MRFAARIHLVECYVERSENIGQEEREEEEYEGEKNKRRVLMIGISWDQFIGLCKNSSCQGHSSEK